MVAPSSSEGPRRPAGSCRGPVRAAPCWASCQLTLAQITELKPVSGLLCVGIGFNITETETEGDSCMKRLLKPGTRDSLRTLQKKIKRSLISPQVTSQITNRRHMFDQVCVRRSNRKEKDNKYCSLKRIRSPKNDNSHSQSLSAQPHVDGGSDVNVLVVHKTFLELEADGDLF